MFSYRHSYHAGCFADVFKHILLVQLIRALQRKDRPFCVLDTHAGSGDYDLCSQAALKTLEFRNGIGRLWGREDLDPELEDYLGIVRAVNGAQQQDLIRYPGSPRLVRALLHEGDRLVLTELHPAEHRLLKAGFAGDRQVSVHHLDGYAALKVFLPPKERRGLVFLDPPYEDPNEFARLRDGLEVIYRRWAGAVTAVWYPILERAPSARFLKALRGLGLPSVLCAELGLYPYDVPLGMSGCGMVVVNPPWRLDETLRRLLPLLLERLKVDERGQVQVEWLTSERRTGNP